MASTAVEVMVVPAANRMSRNTRQITRILAANSAAACSNRNISAVGGSRKTARTNGGDASSDDALPSAHVAAIGAPGIGGRSSHHPSKQAGPAIARPRGYSPGRMCLSPQHQEAPNPKSHCACSALPLVRWEAVKAKTGRKSVKNKVMTDVIGICHPSGLSCSLTMMACWLSLAPGLAPTASARSRSAMIPSAQ